MTLGFGELIKKYRKENKLSQGDFAKLINKSQVTVSNYEKDVHFPSDAEEIKAIARILGQPASYILDTIEYSRKGIVEDGNGLPIELDKEVIMERFKFIVDGEEVTNEELDKMLYIIRFERFMQKQMLKDE